MLLYAHARDALLTSRFSQAWWTLISVLNGADRTGRAFDLQIKAVDEPFAALDDLSSVYI